MILKIKIKIAMQMQRQGSLRLTGGTGAFSVRVVINVALFIVLKVIMLF